MPYCCFSFTLLRYAAAACFAAAALLPERRCFSRCLLLLHAALITTPDAAERFFFQLFHADATITMLPPLRCPPAIDVSRLRLSDTPSHADADTPLRRHDTRELPRYYFATSLIAATPAAITPAFIDFSLFTLIFAHA